MPDLVTAIQCLASATTAISLIFIVKQTKAVIKQTDAAEKSYRFTCDWQSKNKAVELSNYYKDNILSAIFYVTEVLERCGIIEKLRNVRNADIKEFTESELFELTSADIIQQIRATLKRKESVKIMLIARRTLSDTAVMQFPEIDDDSLSEKVVNRLNGEFWNIVADTLNSLEYFAMNFTSKVADESIVFPSLHQTYFKVVRALYFHIAAQNRHPKDKYYTNIIALYHEWNKKDIENLAKANASIPIAKSVEI